LAGAEKRAEHPGPGFFGASAVEVFAGMPHIQGGKKVYGNYDDDYYVKPVHLTNPPKSRGKERKAVFIIRRMASFCQNFRLGLIFSRTPGT